MRLEVCFPLYGNELNDSVTPFDSALRWTVKMTKDNFIGKSVLKDYLPKYKLIKLILDKGIPRSGYPVLNKSNDIIGTITSGSMSVMLNKGIALARVDADKATSESEYYVDIRNKQYVATITKNAFFTGGHK